jgi:hypothetical protein
MQVLNDEQATRFLQQILDQTIARNLEWTESAKSKGRFATGTSQFLYEIHSRDHDELAPYRLGIWRTDRLQQPVETIVSDYDDDLTDTQKENNALLERLYKLVTRRVRGQENLFEELIEDLTPIEPQT